MANGITQTLGMTIMNTEKGAYLNMSGMLSLVKNRICIGKAVGDFP